MNRKRNPISKDTARVKGIAISFDLDDVLVSKPFAADFCSCGYRICMVVVRQDDGSVTNSILGPLMRS